MAGHFEAENVSNTHRIKNLTMSVVGLILEKYRKTLEYGKGAG
jgi:hypothetical protein